MKYFNNPLNIRSGSKWLGLRGTKNGFCEFNSVIFGIRAGLYLLLRNYPKHGAKTISECISRWAPPSENHTSTYINFVCRSSHLKPTDILKNLNSENLYQVLFSMCKMESDFYLEKEVFFKAYYIF